MQLENNLKRLQILGPDMSRKIINLTFNLDVKIFLSDLSMEELEFGVEGKFVRDGVGAGKDVHVVEDDSEEVVDLGWADGDGVEVF
jgi:hypothetical protein